MYYAIKLMFRQKSMQTGARGGAQAFVHAARLQYNYA